MSEALLAFDKAIEPGDIALFFFAGHGFEIGGAELPAADRHPGGPRRTGGIDPRFRISSQPDHRPATGAWRPHDGARARRLPQQPVRSGGGRGIRGSGGLASMTPAEGVFIMFSAGAKQTALDRLSNADRASNSVFTRNLIRRLAEPDLTLVQIAKRLQIDVRQLAASAGSDQTPAYYDQVVGEIVLNPSGRIKPASPPPAETVALLSDVDTARRRGRAGGFGRSRVRGARCAGSGKELERTPRPADECEADGARRRIGLHWPNRPRSAN